MATKNIENILFEETINKMQFFLKIVGLQINYHNRNRGFWENLRTKRRFLLNFFWLNTDVLGEIVWVIRGIMFGKSFLELTKLSPCLALCLLGDIQALYFIYYNDQIFELIDALRYLQSMSRNKLNEENKAFLKQKTSFFYYSINFLTFIKVTLVLAFGLSPFIILVNTYHTTGDIKLIQPFIVSYPFNTADPKLWPILYIHEMWSAIVAIMFYLAPYYLCYACSTFIIFQFYLLKNDLEIIIPPKDSLGIFMMDEEFKERIQEIIERHKKIILCVDLMEYIYSETTLCNVVMSSFLICLTGFNVVAINDVAVVVPFLEFLLMGIAQIYLICYYGDMIMVYSMNVGDAAYNCQWYRAEVPIVKDLMMIATRARVPCRMTALRFTEVNFNTFARILSTSWSYFALLTSVYRK